MGDKKPSNLKHVETIAVTLSKNATQEQRLATLVTNSVVDALTRDGTFQIKNTSIADAQLHTKIETINYSKRRSARFDSLRASEMYMHLFVSWKLIDNQNKTLMSGNERGRSYFTVASNQQTSRNNAFPDAAKNAAEKIIQRIANGF